MQKFLIIASLLVCGPILGQFKEPKNVSIDALMVDTQYTKEDSDEITMFWWMPFDFWETSYAQDPTSSQSDIDALKSMLSGYEVVAVVKGAIGYFGGVTYEPKADVLSQTKVIYKGESLHQVNKQDLPPDLENFMGMMQPMMANMFGPMGENMHFVFFENNKTSKVLPINAKGEDTVTFVLGDFTKDVLLPLNSLLKEKECPVDGALQSGKWNFCPIHGDALKPQ